MTLTTRPKADKRPPEKNNVIPRKPRSRKRGNAGERTLRNTVIIVIGASLLLLTAYPIGLAFVGSFHYWNPLSGAFDFIGLENYTDLLSSGEFWSSLLRTGVFSVVVIFFRVALGLAIAVAIFSNLTRGKAIFRTIFYMPTVTPLVAVAYIWQMMYNPQTGAINTFFGLDINWLYDPNFALPSIIGMTIWKDFGYAVILFLAGLHSIPEDALEAASVDGANAWQRFWSITLPLLAPMTVFVVITSIISYLQAFVQVLVLTQGGPGTSTQLISYLIYEQAFVKYDFGYASAAAFVLLIFTALLTLISFRLSAGRKNSLEG
ncbi:sugar ABC transporter permease [Arthrobacter livingstonensis]|uniref:Sugar ABC transporter permease n=1 Tax=Arthrobacter livingstonensis TaxID=670078 RepID=A0A2V5L8I9_9MICC|nr:sugar ABC transporter permease [Arthrobacter livingstonensis]PYI65963.1 sugar ABC transporter permease [Arthrobacter livingstonensis]